MHARHADDHARPSKDTPSRKRRGKPRRPFGKSLPLYGLCEHRASGSHRRFVTNAGSSVMRMHVLSGGRLRMRRSIYFPGSDPAEKVEMPVGSILMKHPQSNVLFDTGCHPDVATNPDGRWGSLVRVMTPIMHANDNVLESLKAIGHSPDDVDAVVCSHLHPDHCGCNQFFRKAKFFMHARELAAAKAPEAEKMGYFRADWDHPLDLQEVTSET